MTPDLSVAMINGELVPLSKATVSLMHPSFLTSFGVYEAIKVDQGRPFQLADHLERLKQSADLLALKLGYSPETLLEWATDFIAAQPSQTYSMQILVLGSSHQPDEATLITFLPKPLSTYVATKYVQGAKAITYEAQRTLPQCKSMNTLVSHLARTEAQRQNALEALLTHDDWLTEGARSNLFAVEAHTQRLLTPPARHVLSGVTRDTVIKIMQETPYPVIEADIPLSLPLAELFITSTSMHVMPITVLDNIPIGEGRVGPITQRVMATFDAYYKKQISGWKRN